MNTLEKYKQLTQEANLAAGNLRVFVNENHKLIIKDLVSELGAIPGLNKMISYGYTPRWNDGDACYHSAETCFDSDGFYEIAEYEISGLATFLNVPEEFFDEGEELWDWEGLETINTFSEEDAPQVKNLADFLEGLLEEVYGTDYIVFIDFTGDEPVVKHEYYDCGY